ncbi:MAG TPA: type II secretion system protein GspG, partial [Archangium sp.]
IIVVIAILSMLMGSVAVYAIGEERKARRATSRLDVRNARDALDLHRLTTGSYPDPNDGFAPLVKSRAMRSAPPKDAYGNALRWSLEGGEPVVVSLGADGAPGGEGDAEDITSLDAE